MSIFGFSTSPQCAGLLVQPHEDLKPRHDTAFLCRCLAYMMPACEHCQQVGATKEWRRKSAGGRRAVERSGEEVRLWSREGKRRHGPRDCEPDFHGQSLRVQFVVIDCCPRGLGFSSIGDLVDDFDRKEHCSRKKVWRMKNNAWLDGSVFPLDPTNAE